MKTRIKKPLTALMMAWGTYLAIPCPYKVWDDALRPWQIVCLPPVGLIVGGLWALCAALFAHFRFTGLLGCRVLDGAAVSRNGLFPSGRISRLLRRDFIAARPGHAAEDSKGFARRRVCGCVCNSAVSVLVCSAGRLRLLVYLAGAAAHSGRDALHGGRRSGVLRAHEDQPICRDIQSRKNEAAAEYPARHVPCRHAGGVCVPVFAAQLRTGCCVGRPRGDSFLPGRTKKFRRHVRRHCRLFHHAG